MQSHRSITLRRLVLALIAVGAVTSALLIADGADAINVAALAREAQADLPDAICGPGTGGQPALLKTLLAAATKTETAPFQPQADAGRRAATCRSTTISGRWPSTSARACRRRRPTSTRACASRSRFNHAEAQRAFQAAQKLDPDCAMCFWGEALVLGPNINAPMMPEANAAGARRAGQGDGAEGAAGAQRSGADRRAARKRYSADPKAERAALDAAYADAMKEVAARFPADDTVAGALRRSGDGHAALGLLGGRRRAGRRAAAPRSSPRSRRC